MLVYTSIVAACTMLQLERRGEENFSFFYSDFKKSFEKMAKDIEKNIPEQNRPRDISIQGRHQVNVLAEKMIEFYKVFDSWHCGLNQLKTFKKLSFPMTAAPQSKVKQALELISVHPITSARAHTASTPRE